MQKEDKKQRKKLYFQCDMIFMKVKDDYNLGCYQN